MSNRPTGTPARAVEAGTSSGQNAQREFNESDTSMKALFGVASLLVALAIVGLVAVRQLKAVGRGGPTGGARLDMPAMPQMSGSGSGTVREQARSLQNRVADDAIKAMNQAAAARQDEADKQ